MSNGNGFNGFPQWVKIIAQVGFPIAVVIFLLAMMVPAFNDHQSLLKEHEKLSGKQLEQIEEQTRLLGIICRNIAKNDFDKTLCENFSKASIK